jgi:hypothetical protein
MQAKLIRGLIKKNREWFAGIPLYYLAGFYTLMDNKYVELDQASMHMKMQHRNKHVKKSRHGRDVTEQRMGASRSMQTRTIREDRDAELPSIQTAAREGTMQLLGHANHKPISSQSSHRISQSLSSSQSR